MFCFLIIKALFDCLESLKYMQQLVILYAIIHKFKTLPQYFSVFLDIFLYDFFLSNASFTWAQFCRALPTSHHRKEI